NIAGQVVAAPAVAAECFDKNSLPASDCRLNTAALASSIAANDSASISVDIKPAAGYVGDLYVRLKATTSVGGAPVTYTYTDTVSSPHRARLSDIVISPASQTMSETANFHVVLSASASMTGQRDISGELALDCGSFTCGWSGPGGGMSYWYPFTLHPGDVGT